MMSASADGSIRGLRKEFMVSFPRLCDARGVKMGNGEYEAIRHDTNFLPNTNEAKGKASEKQ